MAKIISSYGGITASAIKAKADIPSQSNMTVSGNDVSCTNIILSEVKTAIGSSNNNLSGLCSSPNVNIWSGFGPVEWYNNANVLQSRIKTPYYLGSFAGYNHTAEPPYLYSYTQDFNIYQGQTTTQLQATLFLNEIPWKNIPFLQSINMEVIIDSAVWGTTSHIQLSDSNYLSTQHTFEVTGSTVGWTSNKTATLRFYFGRDAANSWQELTDIPNISTVNVVMTFQPYAVLRNFTVSSILTSDLGGTAEIIQNSTDIANSYVTQLTGGLGSVTLAWRGIDTNNDGSGDLDIIQAAGVYYWFRKNNGTWYYMDDVNPDPVGTTATGGTYYDKLDMSEPEIHLTYGDIVDIELRGVNG